MKTLFSIPDQMQRSHYQRKRKQSSKGRKGRRKGRSEEARMIRQTEFVCSVIFCYIKVFSCCSLLFWEKRISFITKSSLLQRLWRICPYATNKWGIANTVCIFRVAISWVDQKTEPTDDQFSSVCTVFQIRVGLR